MTGKNLRVKKAISPVVGTVLLIALAIVIFGIVAVWLTSMTKEQISKFGSPIKNACKSLDYDLTLDEEKARDSGTYDFYLSNRGSITIAKLDIKFEGAGLSKVQEYAFETPVAGGQGGSLTLVEGKCYPKIIVNPIIYGEGSKSGAVKECKCDNPKTFILDCDF